MSVYLAWSVYKLGIVLLLLLTIAALVATFNTDKPSYKKAAITFSVGLLVVLSTAMNIGDRQRELNRSRFNAPVPQATEPGERSAVSLEDVKKKFQESPDNVKEIPEYTPQKQTFEQAVKKTI